MWISMLKQEKLKDCSNIKAGFPAFFILSVGDSDGVGYCTNTNTNTNTKGQR